MFKKFILTVLSSVLTHCHPVIAEEYPTHVFPVKVWGWGVYNRVEGNVVLPDNRLLKDILIEEGFEKLGSYHD